MKLGPPLLPFLFWPPFHPRAHRHWVTAAGTPPDSSACPWRAGRGPFHKLNCSYRLPCLWLNTKCSTNCRSNRTEQHRERGSESHPGPVFPLTSTQGESQPLASGTASDGPGENHAQSQHARVSGLGPLRLGTQGLSLIRKTSCQDRV